MTRKEAIAAGARHYEGKPCKVCGGTNRLTVTRHCEYHWRRDHLEARGFLERKRERQHVYNRKYYKTHKDAIVQRQAEYRREHSLAISQRKTLARARDRVRALEAQLQEIYG